MHVRFSEDQPLLQIYKNNHSQQIDNNEMHDACYSDPVNTQTLIGIYKDNC